MSTLAPLPCTAPQLLGVLLGQVGQTEEPAGSNRTRYGRETGVDGVPWCAILIGWGLKQLGVDIARWLGTTSWRYTPAVLNAGRAADALVPVEQARAGDIVLYDFPDAVRRTQHIGVVVAQLGGRRLSSVEGNTAVDDDSNGGRVMLRNRPYDHVSGVLRPTYATQPNQPAQQEDPVLKIGDTSPAVSLAQECLRAEARRVDPPRPYGHDLVVDGVFGRNTQLAVDQLQRGWGLPATGEIDGLTYALLIRCDPDPTSIP